MVLSLKQRASIAHATADVNVWDGAIRSGKTLAANLAWMRYVNTAPRGTLAIIGKTQDTVVRNVLTGIQELDPRAIEFRPHNNTCKILGRNVDVIGANDVQAERKLRGSTLAGAYLDEATLVPELFFQTLLGRLSVPGSRLFMTTNPDNPVHWLKRLYLDRIGKLPNWNHWHFMMDDNPSLSEARKLRYRRELVGLWFRRMVLGEWVAAEGAIFDMWDAAVHRIRWDDLPRMHRLLCVGVDPGSTHPTSAVMIGIGVDGKLYAVDEWRHDSKVEDQGVRQTFGQQAKSIFAWLQQPHTPYETEPPIEWVAVDPASANMYDELFQLGVRRIMTATNTVLPGIQLISSLFATKRFMVSSRCPGVLMEIPGYSWDPKQTEKGADQPIKIGDDSIDAMRYGLMSSQNLWRPLLVA